ncbi:uncharacterized protein LOC123207591 [Mangifera indica]|uniref:uncharacterized protein LOC123207591 n=1 Tax=Mangifera indica TaxID=29780 RepID=UPI001CFB6F40|nr:uncharacterized protein LOC123207591 [Mangifera indica]
MYGKLLNRGVEMGSKLDLYKPYRAALNDDWESLLDFYQKLVSWLPYPVSSARDNAFHLAVYSKRKEPLQSLLCISEKRSMGRYGYLIENGYGNTPLHEAAATGNLEAVVALVAHNERLLMEDSENPDENDFLEAVNKKGETPLFIAAAFGRTEVVKFLAPKSLQNLTRFIGREGIEGVTKLKDIHRQRLISVKPKPPASYQLPGAITEGEMIFQPKPGTIQGEIISEPKPVVIPGEIILKPKLGAIQGETIETVPDASILHVAIAGHHFGLCLCPVSFFNFALNWHIQLIFDVLISFQIFLETALYLLNLDDSLATLKDINGWTSLHLLASMPSAFESGYRWATWIHRVFYFCLPIGDDSDNDGTVTAKISKVGKFCASVMRNILEEKRKHKLALKLAERLIEKDSSWDETISWQVVPESQFDEDQSSKGDYKPIPLFLATERGIVEIVNRILEICPQLAEHENDLSQNILHMAIKHRQLDIFNHVKNMKIPMTRLVRKVDKNDYTILHHAADMEEENTEGHPEGPAYQLQDEIKWYKRVNEIMPSHYAVLHDNKQKRTSEGLFKMKHKELLKQAQKWTKGTSNSCSTVAVLVATVAFAAAYTVPGGPNEKGFPVFLNNMLFLVFIVMDAISLICSLTSVVIFLSFLTSPYTYEEFHHTLPNRLSIGFALLFISLTTIMVAFAATLVLIVRSKKPQLTTTIIYTAAIFPVSIFALMNFPLYAAFEKTLLKLYRGLSKIRCVTKLRPPKKPAASEIWSIP